MGDGSDRTRARLPVVRERIGQVQQRFGDSSVVLAPEDRSLIGCQTSLPKVSVVVATLNRPQLLDRCLSALFNQSVPLPEYEVVVVDDGPHAATKAVADEWGRHCPSFSVRYLTSSETHGPAAARNVGWRMAQGPLIAFTDDDCIPDSEWLWAGLKALSDARVGAASGRIVVPIRERPTD